MRLHRWLFWSHSNKGSLHLHFCPLPIADSGQLWHDSVDTSKYSLWSALQIHVWIILSYVEFFGHVKRSPFTSSGFSGLQTHVLFFQILFLSSQRHSVGIFGFWVAFSGHYSQIPFSLIKYDVSGQIHTVLSVSESWEL
jgi:hypothetical protein